MTAIPFDFTIFAGVCMLAKILSIRDAKCGTREQNLLHHVIDLHNEFESNMLHQKVPIM